MAGGAGSIPGWGAKIPHASWLKNQNIKQNQHFNKFNKNFKNGLLSSVQLLSRVWLFVTPWIAACQASPAITNSQSLLKLMSIELVMPSNHLILCHPLLLLPSIFPSIRVFSNESVLLIGGQSIRASVSASVLPVNIQGWFPLGWTGWISLQSVQGTLKSLLKHHSSKASILWCSAFFSPTLTSIHDHWKNRSLD